MLSQVAIAKIKKNLNDLDHNLTSIFGALGDLTRFRIFKLLLRYQNLCVSDLAFVLGITLSAASQHLRLLEARGLVRRKRKGQMICYEVKKENPLVGLIIKSIKRSSNNL